MGYLTLENRNQKLLHLPLGICKICEKAQINPTQQPRGTGIGRYWRGSLFARKEALDLSMAPGDESTGTVMEGCGELSTASTAMPESMSTLSSPFPDRQVSPGSCSTEGRQRPSSVQKPRSRVWEEQRAWSSGFSVPRTREGHCVGDDATSGFWFEEQFQTPARVRRKLAPVCVTLPGPQVWECQRALCSLSHCQVLCHKPSVARAAFVSQTALCRCKLALFIKCIYLAADLLLHMNN